MRMTLPNCSFGGSVKATWLPIDFDIFFFAVDTLEQRNGQADLRLLTACCWYGRPTSRLKSWSDPPSSTSARSATESYGLRHRIEKLVQ